MLTKQTDLSVGPTSILGLLTAAVVRDLQNSGYAPQLIASALAFNVGIIALVLGLLKLGFLLNFISTPVLSGFISAAALVIILGQIPSILGLNNVRSPTPQALHDIAKMLHLSKWQTVLIGVSGIILLEALGYAGKRWGKRYRFIWALSIGRTAIVLVLYTLISFLVNRNRPAGPVFQLTSVTTNSIIPPRAPDITLIKRVATASIAPFIASALEHLAIGKEFATRNNYRLEPSQELTYLGVTNMVNSLFSAMPVGGAMSRTAVASASGVKSPLNGLFTAGFVLLGIFKFAPALDWIPSATLAAIIISAVAHVVGPLSLFYGFWRTSLADFVASMICFWVTLFLSAETGIGFAVLFAIGYTLVRSAFGGVKVVSGKKTSSQEYCTVMPEIPSDMEVFKFEEALLFHNAYRAKDKILDTLMVHHSGAAVLGMNKQQQVENGERSWSVAADKRIAKMRKEAAMNGEDLPLIRVVVLDFENVRHIDTTGLKAVKDLKTEFTRFAGEGAEMRFVNLNLDVEWRFKRNNWKLFDSSILDEDVAVSTGAIVIYESLAQAIVARRLDWEQFNFDFGTKV